MAEQLSGAELDAKFFEVCWPGQVHVDRTGLRQLSKPPVSTDATACEAWAMRWSRQANLRYEICEMQDHVLVVLVNFERDLFEARGADWKQAFVRACVAAGAVLASQKDDGHAPTS